MNKTEQFLVKKIIADYDYWQGYLNIFEEKQKEFETNKKEIANIMREDPQGEAAKASLLYMQYDYANHLDDLRQMNQQLTALYKVADSLNLTDQFTDSLNKKMQKVLDVERKHVFVYEKDKFEEREKGKRKEFVENIENNPMYKEILDIISNKLEKDE